MTYFAIGEPEFEASNWYKQILEGLVNEKRQKRFTLILLNSTDELSSFSLGEDDAVFVIGSESEWLRVVTSRLAESFGNRVIVLGNHRRRALYSTYSVVTSDVAKNVETLYGYLLSHGKKRIALYGVNPASASDSFKRDIFIALGGREEDLFFNNGSLSACYGSFTARSSSYDAVIAVNDYAAISLLKRLGERKMFVTSLGASTIASHFSPTITHTESDYRSFARSGIELARLLCKNTDINAVTLSLAGRFAVGESTDMLPYSVISNESFDTQKLRGDTSFYSDSEINDMIRVERLLNSSDAEDLRIIRAVLDGETYQSVAERLFMSTNGVKYKLKNMFDICEVKGRAELAALLSEYIF